MGRVKEYFMRQQEEGWRTVGDKYVCARCFDEDLIKGFIDSKTCANACSYCKRKSRKGIAAPMDDVLAFMAAGFSREYDIPENCLPYDSSEGGWQGREPLDGYDLVSDMDLVNWSQRGADSLHTDLVRAFSERQYVPYDPFGMSVSEGLRYSWGSFCRTVKHETRFVLFKIRRRRRRAYEPDEWASAPVHLILERIGHLVAEHNLVKELPRRAPLIRARQHQASAKFFTAEKLGAPPAERASQSRMSPAGISMFYGAADEKTAFLETYNPKDRRRWMTFGRFVTSRKLRLLDLTAIPSVPSIFDEARFDTRQGLFFLHELAQDMSKPIERDGREHYEYVPTQIVAEYFKNVLKIEGRRVDGVAFKSSRTGAGASYCIFTGPQGCADDFRNAKAPSLSFERKPRTLVLTGTQRRSVAECLSLHAAPLP